MTVAIAVEVARFLEANEVQQITLMGGEIICHPNWQEILETLLSVPTVSYVRIVTNGDWAHPDGVSKFLTALEPHRDRLNLAVSYDRWHTNARVEAAVAECEARGFRVTQTTDKEDNLKNIVPVGRGEFHGSIYSLMACSCHNPMKKYSLLIDESGEIFKCGFGAWSYASVSEYQDGGFAARFKEFNRVFYATFISSCASCQRAWRRARSKPELAGRQGCHNSVDESDGPPQVLGGHEH